MLAAAAGWLGAGIAGTALAVVGIDAVRALLPDLAISAEALAGTVVALGAAAVAIGLAHLAIGLGLARERGWAMSAGVLLAGVSVAAFVVLAAAALTAGSAGSLAGSVAIAGAAGALVLAAAYAAVGVALARRLRSGPPI